MAINGRDSVFPDNRYIYQTFNRFFDINLVNSSDSRYNGQYLCSAQIPTGGDSYVYLCRTQSMGSMDERKFEYRAKPGFYTGACNPYTLTPFQSLPFGLTTTDNPLLDTYLNSSDFFGSGNMVLFSDLCSIYDTGKRMSNYTIRYRSFVGNPSFRLSGGI